MQNKKKYVSPIVNIERLEADSNFASVCGTGVGHLVIACLEKRYPTDYETLCWGWGFSPNTLLNSRDVKDVVYSNDRTCEVSCYQGPYDTLFTS